MTQPPKPANVGAIHLTSAQGHAISDTAKASLKNSLHATLSQELTKAGITAGLKPGDTVAISSSVGQSISF